MLVVMLLLPLPLLLVVVELDMVMDTPGTPASEKGFRPARACSSPHTSARTTTHVANTGISPDMLPPLFTLHTPA